MQPREPFPDQTPPMAAPWGRLVLVASLGCGLAMVLIYPFNLHSRLWSELFNLAHAPSFLAVYLFIAGMIDPASIGFAITSQRLLALRTRHLMLLAAVLAVIGALCEVLQGLVGRSPSISDALANGCGLAAALFWCLSRQKSKKLRRAGLTLVASGLLVVPSWSPIAEIQDCWLQSREFPILASFERPRELHIWAAHEATIEPTEEWATHGSISMKVQGRAGTQHPGARFEWPVMDWREYTAIEMDFLNPMDRPIAIKVVIFDQAHELSGFAHTDRFQTSITVFPGKPEQIRISLAEIRNAPEAREMNLNQINSINLFTVKPEADFAFLVDNIRLTNQSSEDFIPIR